MFGVIAFDGDDTLWHDDPLFAEATKNFARLLHQDHDEATVRRRLFDTEVKNLARFGYGVKGFILSMIETSLELTEGRTTGADVRRILDFGEAMLAAPVNLIDGAAETIRRLSTRHRLVLISKGDLLDQESKLARSGLGEHFSAVEIVSAKTAAVYGAIMRRLDVPSAEFLMIGNSLRSDILPVLEAGGSAVHISYPGAWRHEDVDHEARHSASFHSLADIRALPAWLETQSSA